MDTETLRENIGKKVRIVLSNRFNYTGKILSISSHTGAIKFYDSKANETHIIPSTEIIDLILLDDDRSKEPNKEHRTFEFPAKKTVSDKMGEWGEKFDRVNKRLMESI